MAFVLEEEPRGRYVLEDDKPAPLSRTDKYLKGVNDPIDALTQLVSNNLPKNLVKTLDNFGNKYIAPTGLIRRMPEGGIDQQIRDDEKQYQAQRQVQGENGLDGYRLTGNILNPVNLIAEIGRASCRERVLASV